MKLFRIAAVLLVIVSLFTMIAAAVAVVYVPSIERKDGPELVGEYDDLIITPLKELIENPDALHEDIHTSLSEAWEELKQSTWQELVADFAAHWAEWTGGAPLEHAIVSDIFDVRYASELGSDSTEGDVVAFRADEWTYGAPVAFTNLSNTSDVSFVSTLGYGNADSGKWTGGASAAFTNLSNTSDIGFVSALTFGNAEGTDITLNIKLQGLTADDVFMIIAKSAGDEEWEVVDYVISEDDVVTIDHTTKTVFAIVRDNGEVPVVNPDDPDSPQTAVPSVFWPAVIGIVLFAGVAVFCVKKLSKRSEI